AHLGLSFEQLLEVLERRRADDERVAEDILFRALQRLDQHEIDRKEAVHHGHEHEASMAELRPPRPRVHPASLRGGSKSLNSRMRTPPRKGSSVRDSADADPN